MKICQRWTKLDTSWSDKDRFYSALTIAMGKNIQRELKSLKQKTRGILKAGVC